MTHPEMTDGDAGPLGPNGALVASPNQTMNYLGIGRAKFYELINTSELQSYVEGSSRKVLWPSIHAYVKRRLAAEATRRGRAA
jgi:predicted DNA-binding transcriptional regulator AlpA